MLTTALLQQQVAADEATQAATQAHVNEEAALATAETLEKQLSTLREARDGDIWLLQQQEEELTRLREEVHSNAVQCITH